MELDLIPMEIEKDLPMIQIRLGKDQDMMLEIHLAERAQALMLMIQLTEKDQTPVFMMLMETEKTQVKLVILEKDQFWIPQILTTGRDLEQA